MAKHISRSASASHLDQVLGTTAHHFAARSSQANVLNNVLNELEPRSAAFASISMITDKLRKLLKARGIANVKDIFDGRRLTTIVEFKNRIKPLGLPGREINSVLESITT